MLSSCDPLMLLTFGCENRHRLNAWEAVHFKPVGILEFPHRLPCLTALATQLAIDIKASIVHKVQRLLNPLRIVLAQRDWHRVAVAGRLEHADRRHDLAPQVDHLGIVGLVLVPEAQQAADLRGLAEQGKRVHGLGTTSGTAGSAANSFRACVAAGDTTTCTPGCCDTLLASATGRLLHQDQSAPIAARMAAAIKPAVASSMPYLTSRPTRMGPRTRNNPLICSTVIVVSSQIMCQST